MNQYSQLDHILRKIMSDWSIPGLEVSIVENGEITYLRGFGLQSLLTHAPITTESVFCIASVSKCFVACAIMQLVEQGKLQLDTPLVHYLPDFRLDDERFIQITLRQMLSHTSGMPDMDELEYNELLAHPEYDEAALERYVHSLAGRKMIAAPGERFAYSNIAYNVLGHLIARTSGRTFEDHMKENILRPAGMTESTFYFPEVDRDRLAVPHLRIPTMSVHPIYPYNRVDAPASFLHATLMDMCRWAITCMQDVDFKRGQLLSPASYDLMWSPVAEWGYPPLYEHTGLGWTLGHYDGMKTVSHGGMGLGWGHFLVLLPEKKCATVILCNAESSARSRIVRAALNIIMDKEPSVGPVSWIVPISQAFEEGGPQAAHTRYHEIKDSPEYYFDGGELVNLAIQLCSAQKIDLAIDVLEFNLQVYPQHLDSLLFLAKLFLQKGQSSRAITAIQSVPEIDPNNVNAKWMLQGNA
ncbi:MAG TPA: serine hydrolase [Anaerolineales bacterium]|nr:serine hydrolase [Anaerolineales bacterium]